MYLFTRAAHLAPGNLQKSMEWSAKMTEKVNAISEIEVSLWNTLFSPGALTLTWTCGIEDLSQMTSLNDKLLADGGYMSLVDEGAKYSSGEAIDDSLSQIIHLDPDSTGGDPQYASVVQAVLAPGSSVAGMELGVQLAQQAKAITGRPTSFVAAVTGTYGGVGWIALYDTIDQVQQANEALGAGRRLRQGHRLEGEQGVSGRREQPDALSQGALTPHETRSSVQGTLRARMTMSSRGESPWKARTWSSSPEVTSFGRSTVLAEPRRDALVAVELVAAPCFRHAVGEQDQRVAADEGGRLVAIGHRRHRAHQ